MMAVMSSMFWGFSPRHTPVMPEDSIWNTPPVLPWVSISKVALLAVTSIMTRFAPGIMTGAYLISSTSISEFIGAMELCTSRKKS